jgi:hypothetical protein
MANTILFASSLRPLSLWALIQATITYCYKTGNTFWWDIGAKMCTFSVATETITANMSCGKRCYGCVWWTANRANLRSLSHAMHQVRTNNEQQAVSGKRRLHGMIDPLLAILVTILSKVCNRNVSQLRFHCRNLRLYHVRWILVAFKYALELSRRQHLPLPFVCGVSADKLLWVFRLTVKR